MSNALDAFREAFPSLHKASDSSVETTVVSCINACSRERMQADNGRSVLLSAAILIARDTLGYGPNAFEAWEQELSDLVRKPLAVEPEVTEEAVTEEEGLPPLEPMPEVPPV